MGIVVVYLCGGFGMSILCSEGGVFDLLLMYFLVYSCFDVLLWLCGVLFVMV